MPSVPNGRVCIFGAGGPVGAAATLALRDGYRLRLTDIRDIGEIEREEEPRSPGTPVAFDPGAPHECRVVDVTDYGQVLDAAQGMDALINATVIRSDPAEAFRVNLIGAYHVAGAAAACGVRRVIHTGPKHIYLGHEADDWHDFDIPDDMPLRPGTNLYALTKHLGGQVTRVFAERNGLEVLVFLYCGFRPSDGGGAADGSGVGCFTVSWRDAGRAFRCGLEAPAMPGPYEVFHICAALPHGKYVPAKAERLLGWRPEDTFERLYRKSRP